MDSTIRSHTNSLSLLLHRNRNLLGLRLLEILAQQDDQCTRINHLAGENFQGMGHPEHGRQQ